MAGVKSTITVNRSSGSFTGGSETTLNEILKVLKAQNAQQQKEAKLGLAGLGGGVATGGIIATVTTILAKMGLASPSGNFLSKGTEAVEKLSTSYRENEAGDIEKVNDLTGEIMETMSKEVAFAKGIVDEKGEIKRELSFVKKSKKLINTYSKLSETLEDDSNKLKTEENEIQKQINITKQNILDNLGGSTPSYTSSLSGESSNFVSYSEGGVLDLDQKQSISREEALNRGVSKWMENKDRFDSANKPNQYFVDIQKAGLGNS